MKVELLTKKHYGTKANPDFNEDEDPSLENPMLLRDLDNVTGTSIVGLRINGEHIDVIASTPIILDAGPGPTSITVTLILNELDIIDVTGEL